MSGFLSRMVARSRGTAEVIRPRVASMFEPQAIASGGDSFAEISEEVSLEQENQEPAPRAEEAEFPTMIPPRTRAPEVEIRESHIQIPPAPPMTPQRRVAPVPDPETIEPEAPAPPRRRTPARLPDSPQSSRLAEGPPKPAPMAPAVPPLLPSPEPLRQNFFWAITEPRHETRPSVAEAPMARRAEIAAAPSLPPLPARMPRLQPAAAAKPAAPPEPSIQINIGRIEVRAATAEPARPKPRTESPVMGLDDYLKSRAAGGSR